MGTSAAAGASFGKSVRSHLQMSDNEVLLHRCRGLARSKPAEALVLLWQLLRGQHDALEHGFDRDRCTAEAEVALAALHGERLPPKVHPAALLSAVDRYLAALEAGYEPRARRVRLPGGEEFFLVPRRAGWASRFARDQAGQIEYWLRRHQVVPVSHGGIRVEITRPERGVLRGFAGRQLRCVAGGFPDGVKPDWNTSSPFHCQCLRDPDRRWASMERFLVQAEGNEAAVVVLPELTVDAALRARISDWLRGRRSRRRPALLVAGSFHEEGLPAGKAPRRNVARVLDGYGSEVFLHTKLRPMRATPGEGTVDEAIEGASALTLLHASFGLIGVAICLDFCESGGVPVASLWEAVGPALMLVPSMGRESTNNAHRARAKPLSLQHGTVTVVASQHPEGIEALGFLWDGAGEESRATPVLAADFAWTSD